MNEDLKEHVCLVTGGSSGIGFETAKALATMGATVITASRASGNGDEKADEIRRLTGNENVTFMPVDLADLADIRRFVKAFKQTHGRLDVLVNNAGLYASERHVSKDGYELTFAVNHLGYFLPTLLLLDYLKQSSPARIVNVSSEAARGGKMHFDDLMLEQTFSGWKAYSQSKLANLLFTFALARKLEGTGVTVNALHPGGVATGFAQNDTTKGFFRWVFKLIRPFLRSPEKGAETAIYLASSPEIEGVTGKYFKDNKPFEAPKPAYNLEAQAKLWQQSEALVHLNSEENPFVKEAAA